ncbi:phage terminase small subunit P27 family [Streptococcus suis]|uniref:Phage terminase, small subunit n=1 Tax=Streptococcus suis TaxID=1307 RepID=A0A123TLW5_STRSU|nr:phage terminase small subunit P27 family [Streptococcus suis]NQH18088.1 phage terminase small subunit P27 family [Streptococcus suis]NQJ47394.1 phage terminase small subunit P27 family [Streptococcus suis]NQJ54243.1 phage terminase small subunit P27 family [Streptococcus suis]NQK33658.1 phage terminase small subunit P27 family [Streptococcus suis]NQN65649.1 phage terminase small subunit P27 family [Streptococcus suis]
MGRKMKVVSNTKKHLTKAEKDKRKEVEELASDGLPMLPNSPPTHFNDIAKAEYRRVIKGLRMLPIRNLDRAVLESYCTWYAVYKEISQKIDEQGLVIYDEDKGWISNPLILTLEKATTNIRMTASQLGLTVDSRMKMFTPKKEEKKESLFDKFGG